MERQRILGLDTKSTACGWGVVEAENGTIHLVDSGLIELDAKVPHAVRLCDFEGRIMTLIQKHGVNSVAIEELMSVRGARTAKVLQMYVTAAMMASWKAAKIVAILLAPQTVRARVGAKPLSPQQKTRYDSASRSDIEKSRVVAVVNAKFGLRLEFSDNDVADAIATAMAGLGGP